MSLAWTAIGTGAWTTVRLHELVVMSSLPTSPPLLLATNSDLRSWLIDRRYGFLPQPLISAVGLLSAPVAGGSMPLISTIRPDRLSRTTSMLYFSTAPRQLL